MTPAVAEKPKEKLVVTKVASKNKIRDSKVEYQVIEWLTLGKRPNWISESLKKQGFKASQPTVKAYKTQYYDQEITKQVREKLQERKGEIENAKKGLFSRQLTMLEYYQEMLNIHEDAIKSLRGSNAGNPFIANTLLAHMNQAIQIREKISKLMSDKVLREAVEMFAARIAGLAVKTFLPNIQEVTRQEILDKWTHELEKIENDILRISR